MNDEVKETLVYIGLIIVFSTIAFTLLYFRESIVETFPFLNTYEFLPHKGE